MCVGSIPTQVLRFFLLKKSQDLYTSATVKVVNVSKCATKSFATWLFFPSLIHIKEKGCQKWSTVSLHWYAYRLPKNFISDFDVDIVYEKF